ncbi:MAG: hypothetical protein U9R68_09520, partial [Planctomycetota bacterium]|nr:hypothetical protein [Planctomycetota bacterium]
PVLPKDDWLAWLPPGHLGVGWGSGPRVDVPPCGSFFQTGFTGRASGTARPSCREATVARYPVPSTYAGFDQFGRVVDQRRYDDGASEDRDVEADGDLEKSGSGLDERLCYTADANMNVAALLDTGGDAIARGANGLVERRRPHYNHLPLHAPRPDVLLTQGNASLLLESRNENHPASLVHTYAGLFRARV